MDLEKSAFGRCSKRLNMRETLDFAKTIERHRYQALWIPEGPGRDPFAHSAYLLSHTESLAIATGIANIWARDAVTMASASRTVAEISDGRFILGIGVSHKPVVTAVIFMRSSRVGAASEVWR
jgi:alkanesulfonate monooxygenase SsuD/methylene tetrahydromethanopterin reductase-like flavin-dependent oxidoreductase (luciferase family)